MYTDETKQKVVEFAKAHNITLAAKEFKISPITVSRWLYNGKSPYARKKPATVSAATEHPVTARLRTENVRLKLLLADTLLQQKFGA